MKFVLMPDVLSASAFRTVLAENNTLGVKVGTFLSLIETLQELWLLPELDDEFDNSFRAQIIQSSEQWPEAPFWSASLKVDESSVLSEIEATFRHLLNALPLDKKLTPIDNPQSRGEKYYNDLASLHAAMEHARPLEQMQVKCWLSVADEQSIEPLEIIHLPELFDFNQWQQELVDKIHQFGNTSRSSPTENVIFKSLSDFYQHGKARNTELELFLQRLFQSPEFQQSTNPNNIRWLTCRDILQEVEVVVGMVQKALLKGEALNQMAIVVPQNSDYLTMLPNILNKAGILTSNHHANLKAYQWDIQLIKDLLVFYCQKMDKEECISPMSLATIVTNPLMPWSQLMGQSYADDIFHNVLREQLGNKVYSGKDAELLKLISQTTHNWQNWLMKIVGKLHYPKDARYSSLDCMMTIINSLIETSLVYDISESEFENSIYQTDYLHLLINQLQPKSIVLKSSSSGSVINGILILTENEWLLKSVNHLFLIGFNRGSYIQATNSKGIFDQDNWKSLSNRIDLSLDDYDNREKIFQTRISSNLSQARKTITFLLSEQNLIGEKLQPSETLLDMALCFQKPSEVNPENLIRTVADINNVSPFLKRPADQDLSNNSAIINIDSDDYESDQDLIFNLDLLALHTDKEGNQRAESPSSLEKMMLSPLAWLLSRQGLEPKNWEIQELGVDLKGIIAHKVFECHFDKDSSLTSDDYEILYSEVLKSEAPFMLQAQWRLERTQLKYEIKKSLLPYINWCKEEGWQVSETEMHLNGGLWDLPMKGFADAVLNKGKQRLILDYKKSKSKDRINRLENGFDLQTVIYRELFAQQKTTKSAKIHSGYYTLNDQTLVLHRFPTTKVEDINLISLDMDIKGQSDAAVELIKKRIKQLRKGIVELNSKDDSDYWNNYGINTIYLIDAIPLVGHFLKLGTEQMGHE